MADVQTTRLSRKWLLKISIFLIGLPVFGLLGLYDGLIKYPKRGERDAAVRLMQFLETHPTFTKIENPAQTFTDLKERAESGERPLTDEDRARLEFLAAMDRLWRLDAETLALPITDPDGEPKTWDIRRGEAFTLDEGGQRQYDLVSQTRSELKAYWDTAKKPAPLDSKFDIGFQWGLVIVCFGLWPWPIWLVLRAARTRYKWNESERRLILPDGSSFTPDDIEDLDKTRWHKFYVTVHLKDGGERTFDLLRFEPLEEWIVRMERTRFPDRAAKSAAAPAESTVGEPAAGEQAEAEEAGVDNPAAGG